MRDNVKESALSIVEEIAHNMDNYQTNFGEQENAYVDEIEQFEELSEKFITASVKAKTSNEILEHVKHYVLELNTINSDTDYALIETDEREQIAEFIFGLCGRLGFQFNYDITEEHREW